MRNAVCAHDCLRAIINGNIHDLCIEGYFLVTKSDPEPAFHTLHHRNYLRIGIPIVNVFMIVWGSSHGFKSFVYFAVLSLLMILPVWLLTVRWNDTMISGRDYLGRPQSFSWSDLKSVKEQMSCLILTAQNGATVVIFGWTPELDGFTEFDLKLIVEKRRIAMVSRDYDSSRARSRGALVQC
jgi:hypothetical protein